MYRRMLLVAVGLLVLALPREASASLAPPTFTWNAQCTQVTLVGPCSDTNDGPTAQDLTTNSAPVIPTVVPWCMVAPYQYSFTFSTTDPNVGGFTVAAGQTIFVDDLTDTNGNGDVQFTLTVPTCTVGTNGTSVPALPTGMLTLLFGSMAIFGAWRLGRRQLGLR